MRLAPCLMVILLLLSACDSSQPATPTPEIVVIEITATVPPPTATSVPTTTPSPEPTRTVRPTHTPTPVSSTADGGSTNPDMSADGRFIVFESEASNISDTTPVKQCVSSLDGGRVRPCQYIYLVDRELDELTMVSVKFNNFPADGNSYLPVVSDDGRYVAYMSYATNLETEEIRCEIDGQWFSCPNVFVYDRTTRRTTWVSRPVTDPRPIGVNEVIPSSLAPSMSNDGRFITYLSRAANLVADDTNDAGDIFVFDRESGTNRIVSRSTDGQLSNGESFRPMISGDGRVVVFASFGDNLVPDDTNETVDVFAHDLATGATTRVSVASDGTEADWFSEMPSISDDGRYVLFESIATTLDPNDQNFVCDLDGDGEANQNCVDVFLHDRTTGTTTLVSLSANGEQNFDSSISGQTNQDASVVLFSNSGSGLVPGDGNNAYDLFIRDLRANTTTRISVASDGTEGDHQSGIVNNPTTLRPTYALTGDGRYIVFASSATNFVANDLNNGEDCEAPLEEGNYARDCSDIFLHDRETGETILISAPRKIRE